MTTKTTNNQKSLTEAAADVLAASIARSHSDAFGAGTKLFRSTGTDASPQILDLGGAHDKTDMPFPDFTRGVPRAQYPGQPPPVGEEPMPTVETQRGYAGKQPQKTEGYGENKGIEGRQPRTADQHGDRMPDNTFHTPKAGGMIQPPWAVAARTGNVPHREEIEYNDEEFEELITELKKHKDKEDFFDKFKKEGKKVKMKLSDKQKKDCKEALDLTDEQLDEILCENVEDENNFVETFQAISAEILAAHREKIDEDVNAILAGENLSAEFKHRAATVFEAAVATRVNEIVVALENVVVEEMSTQLDAIKEQLTEDVDDYLNYTVQEWIKENEIAIEKGLKAEIVEDFILGLKNLFIEHYIDIPEDKMDLVGELQDRVEELEANLDEEISRGVALTKELAVSRRDAAINEMCEGLTMTQATKLRTLAESVVFVSDADFGQKLSVLKENYFPTKIVPQATDALDNRGSLLTEEGEEEEITDPRMRLYADVISKSKN